MATNYAEVTREARDRAIAGRAAKKDDLVDHVNAHYIVNEQQVDRGREEHFKYDHNGYDRAGYDAYGQDRGGQFREGSRGFNVDGFDRHGYDELGYDKNGVDRFRFTRDGVNIDRAELNSRNGHAASGKAYEEREYRSHKAMAQNRDNMGDGLGNDLVPYGDYRDELDPFSDLTLEEQRDSLLRSDELDYEQLSDEEIEAQSEASLTDARAARAERAERGVISVDDAKDKILGVQYELRHEGKYGDRESAAVSKAFDALNELEEKGVTEFPYTPTKEKLSSAIDTAKQNAAKEAEDTKLTLDTHAMVEAQYRDEKKTKELESEPNSMQWYADSQIKARANDGVGLTEAEFNVGIAAAREKSGLNATNSEIIPPPRLDDRHISRAVDKEAIREEIRDAKAAGKTSCVVQGSDLEIRREFMKEAYRQGMRVHTPDAGVKEEYRRAVVSVEKERAAERLPEQSPSNDGPEYGR